MEASVLSYLLENGPISAIAGVLFWLWRNEIKLRQDAETALLEELRSQITLWKNLKELSDAT